MKFLSVRIGGNELTLAGVVKEDLTCSGSSLPKKKGGPSLMSSSSQAGQLTSSQAYDMVNYRRNI